MKSSLVFGSALILGSSFVFNSWLKIESLLVSPSCVMWTSLTMNNKECISLIKSHQRTFTPDNKSFFPTCSRDLAYFRLADLFDLQFQ